MPKDADSSVWSAPWYVKAITPIVLTAAMSLGAWGFKYLDSKVDSLRDTTSKRIEKIDGKKVEREVHEVQMQSLKEFLLDMKRTQEEIRQDVKEIRKRKR